MNLSQLPHEVFVFQTCPLECGVPAVLPLEGVQALGEEEAWGRDWLLGASEILLWVSGFPAIFSHTSLSAEAEIILVFKNAAD